MDQQLKRELFDLISKDRLSEVIEKLQHTVPIEHNNYADIIMLARRLKELERDEQSAIIALDDASLARNQITQNLLGLLKNMSAAQAASQAAPNYSPPPPPPPREPQRQASPPTGAAGQGYAHTVEYKGSACAKQVELYLQMPYEAAFEQCLAAIEKAGMSVKETNRATGEIRGKRGANMLTSYGERIFFWLYCADGRQTLVTIISDSWIPTTLFDWGRNKANLEKLMAYLR